MEPNEDEMFEIKTRWIGKTGDERAAILAKIDADEQVVRVGKKAAGRILDGSTWDEFPS
ncbi:MAG: hypothetical protein ORN28_06775 [Rhodoferax sp.]|nr:hypothetical protein [Rhodoferax sp.]